MSPGEGVVGRRERYAVLSEQHAEQRDGMWKEGREKGLKKGSSSVCCLITAVRDCWRSSEVTKGYGIQPLVGAKE